MWDMRNVAAEKTTPLRLDPDPIRACPAPIPRRAMRSRRPRVAKLANREAAKQMISQFVDEERKLSLMATIDATQKTAGGRGRKKSEATDDLPPLVRNPEMRRRRVTLAEAMREIGFDEAAVAETLMEILTRRRKSLTNNSPDIAADKFLLDVVKESVRILDGAKSVGERNCGGRTDDFSIDAPHSTAGARRVKRGGDVQKQRSGQVVRACHLVEFDENTLRRFHEHKQ